MLDGTDSITESELLSLATVFEIAYDANTKKFVRVELRAHPPCGRSWATFNETRFVLTRDGGWEYDPPLGGDSDFLARTRWDDSRGAVRAALQAIKNHAKEDCGHSNYPQPCTVKPSNGGCNGESVD